MKRSLRRLVPLAVGLLLLAGAPAHRAIAQDPAMVGDGEGEGKSEGRPWDGYIATGLFAGLALFLVGKSARR